MSSSLQPPNISTSPTLGLYISLIARAAAWRGPGGSCMTATVQLLIRRDKTASPARWGLISLRSFPLCSVCLSAFVSRFLCSLYLSNLGPSLWSSSRSKPGVHDLSSLVTTSRLRSRSALDPGQSLVPSLGLILSLWGVVLL